jgi:hypothetical protein
MNQYRSKEDEMALVEIHARLANTTVLFCVIMALWGSFRFLRKKGVTGSYWGATVIAEILILLQGVLGIYLWIISLRPDRGIHPLYGVVTALAIPFVYVFTKGREDRPEMLMYSVAFLMMIGLLLRAIVTG